MHVAGRINLVSLNMKPKANIVTVEGRRWPESIYTSKHMRSVNQNT